MNLKPSELDALKWAVEKAREWHGFHTGDPHGGEQDFLAALGKAESALKKLSTGPTEYEYKSANMAGNFHDAARAMNLVKEWQGWELCAAECTGFNTVLIMKRRKA